MSVPGPNLGPCEAWIDGNAIAACCPSGPSGTDPEVLDRLDRAAVMASMALFELSGRQFTGLCTSLVRPCSDRCGCFGVSSGLEWRWLTSPIPGVGAGSGLGLWSNECGDRCGCTPLEQVKLAGYPVRQILTVKIDGAVLDPAAYRLDRWRYLVRVDGGRWPGCQNLAAEDDQPGTFSIEYRHGVDPPELGRDAAAEVACQILAACTAGAACVFPQGVTAITRQGVNVQKDKLVKWLSSTGETNTSTGLANVDLFLRAYWQAGATRPSAVWSPDVRKLPRRVAR